MTTQNKNVPALRFPEFDGEWEKQILGSIYSDIVVGFVGTVSDSYCDPINGVPFIRTLNVKDGYFSLENIEYVTHDFHNANGKSKIYNGDILIARVGANMGQVCKVTGLNREANSANVIIIKKSDYQSSDFYSLYLGSKYGQKQIKSKGAGGAQAVLNVSVTKTILAPKPTLFEQQKIAAFLTTVDEKIQQLAKKKDLLEQYKKGVMQKIFNQEIRFKDDIGNDFADWEERKGNEVFESISNKNHNSDLPILAITQDYGAIPRDQIDYQISVTEKSVEGYKLVEIGDFIISLRSFQGGIEYSNYKGICSPAYVILRAKIAINNIFFKYYLKTDYYIQQLNKKLEGIRDGKMISYKYFSEIDLPFPCLKEQNKIADFFTAIDEKINLVNQQLEKTRSYKKGLLQQMFV